MASCSLDKYLDGLASQLKDCTRTVNGERKHVRWTREHLIWIMCLAASQIKADRGDLFLTDKRIKLSLGCYTTVCDQGCSDIRGPILLEGQECEKIAVKTEEDTWGDEFFPNLCSSSASDDSEYVIESIEIDSEDPCKIKVNPPVPDDGVQRYLIARCTEDIEGAISDENESLPDAICENINAFTQLVLFYAYSMDGMVNVGSEEAQKYFDNYRVLINDSFLRDLSLNDSRVLYGQVSANLGE